MCFTPMLGGREWKWGCRCKNTDVLTVCTAKSLDICSKFVSIIQMCMLIYMGQNYQDGKYALSISLFVSFCGDLESKLVIGEPKKKHRVGSTFNKRNNS